MTENAVLAKIIMNICRCPAHSKFHVKSVKNRLQKILVCCSFFRIFQRPKKIMCSLLSILSNIILEGWKALRAYTDSLFFSYTNDTIMRASNFVNKKNISKRTNIKICVKPMLRNKLCPKCLMHTLGKIPPPAYLPPNQGKGDGNKINRNKKSDPAMKEEILDVLSNLSMKGTATTSVACLEELYRSDEYAGALCDTLFVVREITSSVLVTKESSVHSLNDDEVQFLKDQLVDPVQLPEASKDDLMGYLRELRSFESISVRERKNPQVIKVACDSVP